MAIIHKDQYRERWEKVSLTLCHAEPLCQKSLETQLKTTLEAEQNVKKHTPFVLCEKTARHIQTNTHKLPKEKINCFSLEEEQK